jgi:hypothetical protein
VGDSLVSSAGSRFTVDIYNRDPNLRTAFACAGAGRLTSGELDLIDTHSLTVYLLAYSRGFPVVAEMIEAASALLSTGGFAAKIESSGLAHNRTTWFALRDGPPSRLVDHFVVYVSSGHELCSCGMHSFDLSDAAISLDADPGAQNLLATFNRYQATEQPSIRAQDTFQPSPNSPVYRLDHRPYSLYSSDSLFYNPNGLWHLQILSSN